MYVDQKSNRKKNMITGVVTCRVGKFSKKSVKYLRKNSIKNWRENSVRKPPEISKLTNLNTMQLYSTFNHPLR